MGLKLLNAQGNHIVTTDSAAYPAESLSLYGKSVQGENPTPQNPQPIESVGDDGDIVVDVLGANLCDASYNINGFILCVHGTATEDNGVLTINATGADAYAWIVVNAGMEYKAEGGQLISIPNRETEITISISNQQYDNNYATFYDENKVSLGFRRVNTGTYQIPEGAKYFSFRFGIENSIAGTTYSTKVMVNYGTEPLPWQPYQHSGLTVSTPNGLPGIPVESGGNYTDADGQQYIADEIRLNADGTGKWVHIIETIVADGTTAGYDYNHGNNRGVVHVHKAGKHFTDGTVSVMSDKFKGIAWKDRNSIQLYQCFGAFDVNTINLKLPENVSNRDDVIEYFRTNPTIFHYVLAEPYETDLSAEEVQAFLSLRMNRPYTTILNDEDCFMGVEYVGNAIFWTAPKTNWQSEDRFNIADYNRIKWNLEYLHKKASELYRYFDLQYMGDDIYLGDKKAYTARWDVADFNAFEQNLENINKNIFTQDYGIAQRFYANAPFIKWDELNRIESATLNMKKILVNLEAGLPRLAFRLGANKEVKV